MNESSSPDKNYEALVDKAVAVLQRHIVPDGLSDHDALTELYGIFDGPEYRAAKAQVSSTRETDGPFRLPLICLQAGDDWVINDQERQIAIVASRHHAEYIAACISEYNDLLDIAARSARVAQMPDGWKIEKDGDAIILHSAGSLTYVVHPDAGDTTAYEALRAIVEALLSEPAQVTERVDTNVLRTDTIAPTSNLARTDNNSVPVAVLREHWLRAVECDHEGKRDKPHCACSTLDLGWHPTISAAVDAWLAHLSVVAEGGEI